VVFTRCLLLHSSSPNHSDRFRHVFLPAYRAADAYPIYFGPHASHNEPGVTLLRGNVSDTARVEPGTWRLPLAQGPFGSLFPLQEGRCPHRGTRRDHGLRHPGGRQVPEAIRSFGIRGRRG
jgi:phytanoyl-CoA hydroxylase